MGLSGSSAWRSGAAWLTSTNRGNDDYADYADGFWGPGTLLQAAQLTRLENADLHQMDAGR